MCRAAFFSAAAIALTMVSGGAADAGATFADQKLARELCAGLPGCRLAEVSPAGRDALNRRLSVYELAIDEPESADSFGCVPYRRQFWLVTRDDRSEAARRLVLELCNDGYGAAQVGEDTVTIRDNRLVHVQYGGSAWRWENTTEYSLSPFLELSQESCSFHTLSTIFDHWQWDWGRFSGRVLARGDTCDADGNPVEPATEEGMELGCPLDQATHAHDPIPLISLPDDMLAPMPELGSCATLIDSSGWRGFVVHGEDGLPDDAWMRLLAVSETDLVVTVGDDSWHSGGSSWVFDDHLEIWTAPGAGMPFCGEAVDPPKQWAVRVADGAVFPAFGDPLSLPTVAERRQAGAGRPITLRISFPEPIERIAVVYSDSDDGTRQERLIASSDLHFGDALSLGEVVAIDPLNAWCSVRDGRLDVDYAGRVPAVE